MTTNLQGSSNRPRVAGFRLRNRKDFIYENIFRIQRTCRWNFDVITVDEPEIVEVIKDFLKRYKDGKNS